MQRLYTAFVSSTFEDLQEERWRLVSSLLSHHRVPLGMEFFPSIGRSQWPVIEESIGAADFCIFVVAGRYGTISADGNSWTHREFREAVRLGKPLVGILHAAPGDLPASKSETTAEGRAALERFRAEIERQTICRFYRDAADLLDAVSASFNALKEAELIEGWVPAGRKPVVLQESQYDRVYEVIETHWWFEESERVPDTWDGRYVGRRRLVANDPDGLELLAIDFTRETDRQLPFDELRRPQLRLRSATRSGGGHISLRPPRRQLGGAFVQDVVFNPPLSPGEVADFTVEGELPSYKFGVREDLAEATIDSKLGPRTYDWASRRIAYPTRDLSLSVFLPLALRATPRGPQLAAGGSRSDPELTAQVVRDGSYSCTVVERDGVEGFEMRLETSAPRMLARYRLTWELPSRSPRAA